MTDCKRIAITPGEPAGIGPELIAQIASQPFQHELVIIADPALIKTRANHINIPLKLSPVNLAQKPTVHIPGHVKVLPLSLAEPAKPGELNPKNVDYVLETLNTATKETLTGTFSAIVTGPIHKGVIANSGRSFSGHTEYFSELCGGCPTVMMLMNSGMKVALTTTHLPLSKVPGNITEAKLTQTISIVENALKQQFHIKDPKIAVCGLNPHAGEDGTLGREEIDTIIPTLEKLRSQGIQLIGPLPADTAFTEKHLAEADITIAMYHDQGLPVIKHQGFGKVVNVTLGLPFVRTSVDHGTALGLAGTGTANPDSLLEAIRFAEQVI